MQNYCTIQVNGGKERDLGRPTAGIDGSQAGMDFQVDWQSKGKTTATISTSEAFDPAATQWKFKDKAVIRVNRQSADGTDDSFSGGEVLFRGYFDDPKMESTERQGVLYQVHDPWWLFERNPFKQYVMRFTGFSDSLQRVLAATVATKGQLYKAGDTLTIKGGAAVTAATAAVAGVDANGGVTLVVLTNGGGSYGATPPSPAPTDTNSANGSGCTLALVFQPAPILEKRVISQLFLGEDLHTDGGFTAPWPNGNGDQIGEIIAWMNETYNPTRRGGAGPFDASQDVVQAGRLDPHTKMPVDPQNTLFCSEAVNKCLRWDPDAVVQFDHSTAPPTMNVLKLGRWNYATIPPTFLDYANLPEVTVDINADTERQILNQGQVSRQLPGVIIYYKFTNNVDGALVDDFVVDAYPPGITDYTPEVSAHTVELLGSQITHQVATVAVEQAYPFALLLTGAAADQVTWWKGHDKSLSDPAVNQASIAAAGPPTVLDDAGNPVDTSVFKYELVSDIPSFTGQVLRATVSQNLDFTRFVGNAKETGAKGRLHTKRVKLTNLPGGSYSVVTSVAQQEVPPQNVAESVYRSLAAQQWAGTITVLSDPMRTDIKIGTRLKLVGPSHTFTNLMVQSVTQRPARGEVSVRFGPGPEVDMDVWIELARASRYRITWELPSNRGDGGSGGGGSSVNVDTSAISPSEDTSHSVGGLSAISAVGSPI